MKSRKNNVFGRLTGWLGLAVGLGQGMAAAGTDAVIGVLPFHQICEFKHAQWNIEQDIPAFMLSRLVNTNLKFVPFEKMQEAAKHDDFKGKPYKDIDKARHICRQVEADYLILGEIINFKVLKKTAVMPDIGGYKQYDATLDLKLWFYDRELEDFTFETNIQKDLVSRGLKFNPPGRISRDEDDYLMLEKVKFGDQAFMRTVIGETMLRATQDFETKVENFLNFGTDEKPDKEREPAPITEARILQVDGADAFINAGRDDNIRNGDIFEVYTRGEPIYDPDTKQKLGYAEKKVGQIKVAQVKASHFSRVKVIEGEGEVKVMDIVRLR